MPPNMGKYGCWHCLANPSVARNPSQKQVRKEKKHFSWDFSFLPILYLVIQVAWNLPRKPCWPARKSQGPTRLLFGSARLIIAFHHTEHLCALWDPVPAQEVLEQLSHVPPPHFFNRLQFMDMQIQKARYFPPTVPGI